MRTVLAMLGDYGASAEPQTLMARRNDGVRNDVQTCAVRGASPHRDGIRQRLDEALVKRLTGGTPLSAVSVQVLHIPPAWRTWRHEPQAGGQNRPPYGAVSELVRLTSPFPTPSRTRTSGEARNRAERHSPVGDGRVRGLARRGFGGAGGHQRPKVE